MSKKKSSSETTTGADGHTLIDGARWHYPKVGSPTECAISGCDRVLGQTPVALDDEDSEEAA